MLTGLERTTGTISTFWQSGILTFSCVVIQANIKMLFVQSRWTWYFALALLVGPTAWFISILTINLVISFDYNAYHVLNMTAGEPLFWVVLVICLTVVAGKDAYSCAIDRHFNYKPHHIIEEHDAGLEDAKSKGRVQQDVGVEEKEDGDRLGELRQQMMSPKLAQGGLRGETPNTADSDNTLYTDGDESYWTGSEYTESRPASSVPATPITPGGGGGGRRSRQGTADGAMTFSSPTVGALNARADAESGVPAFNGGVAL
jgi:hypothetical protein